MKTVIHPNYYVAKVTCACGNVFQTRATHKEINLEICSSCHPFYTGVQRFLDAAGRVERFQKRFAKTQGKTIAREPKAKVKKKLESQTALAKGKHLSTAPKKSEKSAEKPPKKTAKKE